MSVTKRGPQSLSMKQVRQAGVFAWREDGTLFAHGRLLRIHIRATNLVQITASVLDADLGLYREGWHHLPDCFCEFCSN
jgi:hypothetical protein